MTRQDPAWPTEMSLGSEQSHSGPIEVSVRECEVSGDESGFYVIPWSQYLPSGKYTLMVIGAFKTEIGTVDPESNLKIQIK
jgi:hypothetical protein